MAGKATAQVNAASKLSPAISPGGQSVAMLRRSEVSNPNQQKPLDEVTLSLPPVAIAANRNFFMQASFQVVAWRFCRSRPIFPARARSTC